MREDAPVFLRPMASADADAVQRLWATRFGGDPSTQQNWIEAALNPDHTAMGIVAVAPNEALVGLSFLEVGSRSYTRRYLGLEALGLQPPLADRNGLFHLSCVREEWEGRGVGTAFYERRLDVLAERDVPRAYGIAWHRPHTIDSRTLFEKHDFTAMATVERYYARTGGRPMCPDCNGACSCTASLYTRTVDPSSR